MSAGPRIKCLTGGEEFPVDKFLEIGRVVYVYETLRGTAWPHERIVEHLHKYFPVTRGWDGVDLRDEENPNGTTD